eukprot:TRINITY_DN106002_c0_g1_i1.p2 TRINITY_DN106002_c0_g1~~TRINITY_DN106002_c0_g1_i1.p2  ORF type:complete len:109 (+),score=30.29 TRINITY_DN106002_c0_g1_i1:77-403(+)
MLTLCRHAVSRAAGRPLLQVRAAGGIKILEESGKAQENLYWAQEDERLIKKMLANHPELSPEFSGIQGILQDSNKVDDQVKLVFMKHGIPPVNKSLIKDIVALVEGKN